MCKVCKGRMSTNDRSRSQNTRIFFSYVWFFCFITWVCMRFLKLKQGLFHWLCLCVGFVLLRKKNVLGTLMLSATQWCLRNKNKIWPNPRNVWSVKSIKKMPCGYIHLHPNKVAVYSHICPSQMIYVVTDKESVTLWCNHLSSPSTKISWWSTMFSSGSKIGWVTVVLSLWPLAGQRLKSNQYTPKFKGRFVTHLKKIPLCHWDRVYNIMTMRWMLSVHAKT